MSNKPEGVSSLVAIWTDRDLDGDQDLFEPNNVGNATNQKTTFWRNETELSEDIVLVEDSEEVGVHIPMAGMGVDSMDLNGDGYLDYCVTDVGPSKCFTSFGSGEDLSYIDSTLEVGLFPSVPAYDGLGTTTIGWAFDFADLGNDGYPDAIHTSAPDHGSGLRDLGFVHWPDLMWRGTADGFEDVTSETGFDDPSANYGLGTADFDGDGHLDAVVAGPGNPPRLFMNQCGAGAWIDVQLVGPPTNVDGYGAIAMLEDSRGTQVRELYNVRATGQSAARFHFGLGDDEAVESL